MMEPEEVRRLIKRIVIIGLFFALALGMYLLGRGGNPTWRRLLVAYGVVVAAVMVAAILLQSGRGGGLASIGGLGGDQLLGTRSATPIAKATYVMGALFLFIFMLAARLGGEIASGDVGVIGPPAPPARSAPAREGGEAIPVEPTRPGGSAPAETPTAPDVGGGAEKPAPAGDTNAKPGGDAAP